jgi:beta-N-acetylhexosaminidase
VSRGWIACACAALIAACGAAPARFSAAEGAAHLRGLSRDARVGQLVIVSVRFDQAGAKLRHLDASTRRMLAEVQPGGVILYAHNLDTVPQVRALVQEILDVVAIPPFIVLDEEGGRVSRLHKGERLDATHTPTARALAAAGPAAVRVAYDIIGEQLDALGVTMDLAPVADLDIDPDQRYLGDRAFAADPTTVAASVVIAIDALRARGVVAVLKHFPGHGRARGDSHTGAGVITASRAELAADLAPFAAAIDRGAVAVLAAHVGYRAYDPRARLASRSPPILTDLARRQLGFDGLIITDALEMKGSGGAEGRAAVEAIAAGADMILGPADAIAARDALRRGLADGLLATARVDQAVARVLAIKARFGILTRRRVPGDDATARAHVGSADQARRLRAVMPAP